MPEPLSNMFITCHEHSLKPNSDLHNFPIEEYIGKLVKIMFQERGTQRREHMWVAVTACFDSKTLVGRLENEPILDVGFYHGEIVTFAITEIEDLADPD
jgi:uncharacterized protein YegJ (DUF2314 family)